MTLYLVDITEYIGERELASKFLLYAETDDVAWQKARAILRTWRSDGEPADKDEPDGPWEFGDIVCELDGVTPLRSLDDLTHAMSVLDAERCTREGCTEDAWRQIMGDAYCQAHDPEPYWRDD